MNLLFVLGGGIGNIVQATPAIQAAKFDGHRIDLKLHCNSSADMDVFNIPSVRRVYTKQIPEEKYDAQLNGPFTPGTRYKAKHYYKTRINYAQHIEEAKVYFDLVEQIGVKSEMPDAKINVGNWPAVSVDPETVAIYPGSKHNWAMKRWDKFDQLCLKFDKVTVVGSELDIHSHGNPAWITKPWKWPRHVEFFTGPLQKVAYLISKCKMFIGNDGGLGHIAAATNVPTFILFGPSSDIKNKPYTQNSHIVAIDLPCRPCQFQKDLNGRPIFGDNKADCPHHMKCMREMSVDFVIDKVNSIMGVQ